MSSSKAKQIQCSPAMVGFSSDKINIFQHIKYLFSTIALAPGALDGMNMVYIFGYKTNLLLNKQKLLVTEEMSGKG